MVGPSVDTGIGRAVNLFEQMPRSRDVCTHTAGGHAQIQELRIMRNVSNSAGAGRKLHLGLPEFSASFLALR